MKKVFWDTNILIDYYDNRSGASAALQLLRGGSAIISKLSSMVEQKMKRRYPPPFPPFVGG